jgi:lactoylglutathione lyase
MIQFAYTIFYVNDVARAIQFYEQAFGFNKKFITPDNSYAELNTGSTTLSFAAVSLASSNLKDGFTESHLANKPFAFEIGFTTHHVEETIATAIAAGATLVEKPKTKPWGQTVAYLRDLDGFLIEICTPIS